MIVRSALERIQPQDQISFFLNLLPLEYVIVPQSHRHFTFGKSSFQTMNGLQRGTLIDWDNKQIVLKACKNSRVEQVSFSEWFSRYGETPEQLLKRTNEELKQLIPEIQRARGI